MNFATDSSWGAAAAAQRRTRLLVGIVVSLMLHAVLLLAYRHSLLTPRPSAAAPETRSIAVWLRPPAPAIVPPTAKPEPDLASSATQPAPRRPQTRRAQRPPVIAMPASPSAPPPSDAFTVEPPGATAPPRLDLDAARRVARQMASEPDPAKADSALARLPAKPLASETKAARAIAGASRRDCKDGLPGGLLAPIFLLMEKKDSGCKW